MTRREITGGTGVIAIIGQPISHSLSPLMQNAAFEALGLDFVYVPFAVSPEHLGDAVRGMRNLGVAGFNVTIPHKEAIIPLLDALSPEAEESGAVNVVKREGNGLTGYNTDGSGLLTSLATDLDFSPTGSTVLILGAGGAARGGASALCRAGVKAITVANRTRDKGHVLVYQLRLKFPDVDISACSLDDAGFHASLEECDLLLNTTSVGMNGTSFPGLRLDRMKKSASVYDMVYTPFITPLLEKAAAEGLSFANGIGMLASQGEHAFRIWTGVPPPAGLMKARLLDVCQHPDRK